MRNMRLLRLLFLFWFAALAGWAQDPAGPYVQNLTPYSATLLWVTDWAPQTPPPGQSGGVAAFRVNQVKLSGLQPNTTYHFEVPQLGQASFTTPPNGHGDFTFVVYGDSRSRHDVHRKVLEKILAAKPAFVVHTGDQVADGQNASQWPTFFEVTRELLRSTPFFPALGNHERNTPFWYQLFAKTSGYYSFDWANAHFTILNSDVRNVTPPEAQEEYWSKQIAWLEEDLEKSRNADFHFVVFHHPPYTAVQRRKEESARVAARLAPLLRKHKVDAVFGGHDHNYQHHLESGIHYVVTGGGGAPLYDVSAPIPGVTLKAESIENYVLARMEGRTVRFEARALDGRLLDSFEISAGRKAAVPAR